MLKIGSRGSDVLLLQAALKEKGYNPGPLDGVFGAQTLLAVKVFQDKMDLEPDGIVGPMTAAALHFTEVDPPHEDGLLSTLKEIDARFKKGTIPWYEAAYRIAKVDQIHLNSAAVAASKALKLKADYQWGEEHTGVPWVMLLGIHLLECNNNPKGCLHNGQLIVGTNRKTTIVPIGRGPFATFRDTIVDAVKLQGLLNSVKPENWSLGMMLKQSELFNGAGYLKYHPKENSPYLWSRTNINDGTGKYISDGKWSESANADAQVGVVAVFKRLEELGEFKPKFAN